MRALERAWRSLATGFCFACFGMGGLCLAIIVFPVAGLFYGADRYRVNRRIISASFRCFVRMMSLTGTLRFDFSGADTLATDTGCVIVANHPTLIDYVVIASLCPHCDCLVKERLWSNLFLRGVVRAAGYVRNDSGAASIERCDRSLKAGNNLLIFPEGTRTPPSGTISRLHRGAANIALRCDAPMRVVRVSCEPRFLKKGEPWWWVPSRRPLYRLQVGERLDVSGIAEQAPGLSIAARQLTQDVKAAITSPLGA